MSNYRLSINRSAYYIHNYNLGDSPSLERALSVYDFISRKYTHHGFIYDEKNKILKIPSGLDIDILLGKLCSDGIAITNIENKSGEFIESRRANKLKCSAQPRDKFQEEAIEFIVAENASDSKRKQRLVTLDTGFGKTVCAIISVIKMKMPAIIISLNLSDQWIERLKAFTDGELDKDIFYLKSWNDIDKLVNMKHPPMGSFYVIGLDAMIAALRDDGEKLHKFYEKFGIGVQIFDESHLHFLKIINVLVNTSVERILFLSATPSRSERSQDLLYRRLFTQNIPSYGEDTHTINKYNIISVKYRTKPSFFDNYRVQPRRGVHAVAYFKYMFKYPKRYYILIDIIRYFTLRIFKIHEFDKNKKVIIYIQNLKGIKLVKDILEKNLPEIDGFKPTVGDYSGNVDKKDRHIQLKNNIILTTYANNAGLDIDGLIMIINLIPMSSEILLKQIRGRLRDKKGYYVDACDIGFDGMIRQRDKRMINHKKNARSIVYYEHDGNNIQKSFS